MKTCCCHSKKITLEQKTYLCLNEKCDHYLRETKVIESRTWNNLFVFFLFSFILIFCTDDFSSTNKSTEKAICLSALHCGNTRPLNPETLRSALVEEKVICADQAYAQILIESGHLKSFLSERANNLLGMRYPFKRQTSAVGIYLPESDTIIIGNQKDLKKYRSKNNYAVYSNWEDCIKDYKLWQDECFKLTDRYVKFLGTYYAEDTRYAEKIQQMIK